HDVRPPVMLAFYHGELVHSQPVIEIWMHEIDKMDVVPGNRPVRPWVFHLDAIPQHAMESAVCLHERGCGYPQDLSYCFLAGFLGNRRVESLDRLTQTPHKHYVVKGIPFRRWFTRCQMRPVPD